LVIDITPRSRRHTRWFTALALVAATGCGSTGPLSRLARTTSPYEQYANTLAQSGLDATALGRDWLEAGRAALQRPVVAPTPFRETGYFAPERPAATAYRMDLRRGRRVELVVSLDVEMPARLFVDVFEVQDEGDADLVTSLAAGSNTLSFEVSRDATYLIRVQPELLRGGRFTIEHRTLASIRFPVTGLGPDAVQSEFGAVREAGRRAHEGIDIFASRGTPVVAAVEGVARASTNGLGGNVVWLQDTQRRRTFYYAHLDRWAFDGTRTVQPGEVLGYVGNTGNARTTAPHLHFGIYEDGAIDPLPFLAANDPEPAAVRASLDPLGERVRVSQARISLMNGPDVRASRSRVLPVASLADVVGASGSMYRLHLPDGAEGYVAATAVSRARTAWQRDRLGAGTALQARPSVTAPVVDHLDDPTLADVLGVFDTFRLVRTPEGLEGWITDDSRLPATGGRLRQ
jgi:murein DD-endopeptidase MepM/ murein hydrolase activator NlpD/SH3-like domain-containing protein